jgi:hypothetical protein
MVRFAILASRLLLAVLLLVGLSVIAAPAVDAARVVSVKSTGWEGEYRAEASGFVPGEMVSVRLLGPGERVIKFEREEAGRRGRVRLTFLIPRYEPGGSWTIRFEGVDSEKKAKETFDVPMRGPNVELAATPGEGPSGTAFTLAGAGFDPGERVSAWLTRPDGQQVALGETRADATGRVTVVTVAPPDVPPGTWFAAAYGLRSDRLGAAAFRVG